MNSTSNLSLSVAILGCESCPKEWEVTARIRPHTWDHKSAERKAAQRERSKAA